MFLLGTDWMLAAFLAAALSVAAYELVSSAVKVKSFPLYAIAVLMPPGIMLWAYIGASARWYLLLLCVTLPAFCAVGLGSGGKITFTAACVAFVGAVVLPLTLVYAFEIFRLEHGRFLILLLAILPVASDTGALICGKIWGKHRLAPTISPGKTKEGAAGGILGAIVGVVLMGLILQLTTGLAVRYELLAVLAVPCSLLAQIGDLTMSYAKREFGIKDFGSLIPGHGGVLDRIDSWFFVAPWVYVVFVTWPPVA
jgi:phosphatidate cytidylyltransferase